MADISDLPAPPKGPSKADISDLPAPPKKEKYEGFGIEKVPGEALSSAESLVRGGVAGTVAAVPSLIGLPGTISELVTGSTSLPTMGQIYTPIAEGVKSVIPRITKKTERTPGFEAIGEVVGVPVPSRTVAKTAEKVAEVGRAFKTPEPIAERAGLLSIGEKLESKVKGAAGAGFQKRAAEAENLYENALTTARRKQAQQTSFGLSDEGKAVVAQLEAMKRIAAGDKNFEVAKEKINALNRTIDAVKASVTGGEKVPIGKGKVSARLEKTTPTKVTEKDIDSVITELRFLREVNKPGTEFTGYKALDANTRRDIINVLEQGLYRWSPEYQAADAAYKAASQRLRPFQTRLMDKLLKREKYDPSELAKDTEEFASEFFRTADSVKNLKVSIQDDAFVNNIAKEYVATTFANKSPAEIRSFARDPKNEGWMKESGIYDVVNEYANRAVKAEKYQDIAKRMGIIAGGLGIGFPVASRIGSMIGGF
jgi:hypothetical protein